MTDSATSLSRPSGVRGTFSRLRLPPFARTVRFRLTVWYASLLLVFGVAFVIALNVAVRVDRSPVLVPDFSTARVDDIAYRPVAGGPGQAVETTRFQPVVTLSVLLREAEGEINSSNLDRLQTWSILAVVGLALASGVGGYVLSGVMLRPVRDITSVAAEITSSSLGRRINYQGPEDEMKDLADTFDSMISRLERAFESQRRFVQDASHELRTPLAAIRTNIEVFEMEETASVDEYRELLETVKAQTRRLARLSDDLMLLTTSEDAELELSTVDTVSLAHDVLDQLHPLAEQRHVALALEAEGRPQAWAAPDLLYRCVSNLVDNAIKYSGNDATVTVRARQAGARVEIAVADTGPGIPPADRLHIFDRFYRVDKGRARREGGSGLGLAIVRELCEAMQGDVRVDGNDGRGSVFTISLDAAKA